MIIFLFLLKVFAEEQCGILVKSGGTLDLFHEKRTRLLEKKWNQPIPCDTWISIQEGYAQVKLNHGFLVFLGKNTEAQLLPSEVPQKEEPKKDKLSLLKGKMFLKNWQNTPQSVEVITSSGRAMISDSSILLKDQQHLETQLMNFKKNAILLNRFDAEKKAELAPGEISSLSFAYHLSPTFPTALSLEDLKGIVEDMSLPKDLLFEASTAVLKRNETQMIAIQETKKPSRSLASIDSQKDNYQRHAFKNQGKMFSILKERMAGGNYKSLFSQKKWSFQRKKFGKIVVENLDNLTNIDPKVRNTQEEREKKWLLESLLNMHEED